MIYKEKLLQLRKKIPIGLKQGLQLLEKTQGNIEAAEMLFRQETLAIVIKDTGVLEEIAQKHLLKNNYDITKTIEAINEEKYTLTESVLRKQPKDKEHALYTLSIALTERAKENHLNGTYFDYSYTNHFSIMQYWLDYEDYEGFRYALGMNELNEIIEFIKSTLLLEELAKNLSNARNRQKEIDSKYHDKIAHNRILYKIAINSRKARHKRKAIYLQYKNKMTYKKAWYNIENQIYMDKKFNSCGQYFQQNRNQLINSLYDYVVKNKQFFP